jgi:hypothetical protein
MPAGMLLRSPWTMFASLGSQSRLDTGYISFGPRESTSRLRYRLAVLSNTEDGFSVKSCLTWTDAPLPASTWVRRASNCC